MGLPRNERILVTNRHIRVRFFRRAERYTRCNLRALIVLGEFRTAREGIILFQSREHHLAQLSRVFDTTIFVYTFLRARRDLCLLRNIESCFMEISAFPGIPHLSVAINNIRFHGCCWCNKDIKFNWTKRTLPTLCATEGSRALLIFKQKLQSEFSLCARLVAPAKSCTPSRDFDRERRKNRLRIRD